MPPHIRILKDEQARIILDDLGARVQFVEVKIGDMKLDGFYDLQDNHWIPRASIILSLEQLEKKIEESN